MSAPATGITAAAFGTPRVSCQTPRRRRCRCDRLGAATPQIARAARTLRAPAHCERSLRRGEGPMRRASAPSPRLDLVRKPQARRDRYSRCGGTKALDGWRPLSSRTCRALSSRGSRLSAIARQSDGGRDRGSVGGGPGSRSPMPLERNHDPVERPLDRRLRERASNGAPASGCALRPVERNLESGLDPDQTMAT